MAENKLLKAWHASPYDFEKFGPMRDVSGKGQGAAAYGRGAAYVAENPAVSGPGRSQYMAEFQDHPAAKKGEKVAGVDPEMFIGGGSWTAQSPFDTLPPEAHTILSDAASGHYLHGGSGAKSFKQQLDWDIEGYLLDRSSEPKFVEGAKALKKFMKEHYKRSAGGSGGPFSYEVNVHLKPETMLDWDTKFEDHHPEAQDKITKAFEKVPAGAAMDAGTRGSAAKEMLTSNPGSKGSTIYNLLTAYHGNSDFDASEALFNAGIHGIRYKDGGSRNLKSELYIGGQSYDENDPFHQHVKMATSVANSYDFNDIKDWMDEHVNFMKREADQGEVKPQAYEFWRDIRDRFITEKPSLEMKQPRPTYNYVIFHPDFVEAVAQYNIKGEKVKDLGPGVHLKAVDHDPFKGEK